MLLMQSRIRLLAAKVRHWFLPTPVIRVNGSITYAGGDGSSLEKAVVINGGNVFTGVQAERAYLAARYPGYMKGKQALLTKGKQSFDRVEFTTAEGDKNTVFFDVTDFFGKLD